MSEPDERSELHVAGCLFHTTFPCSARIEALGISLLSPEPYQVGTANVSTGVRQGEERLILGSLLLSAVVPCLPAAQESMPLL